PAREEITRLVTAWLGVIALLLLAAFWTKTSAAYSRRMMTTWVLLAPALLWTWRLVTRVILQEARVRGYNSRSAAIVGVSPVGARLAERIALSPWMGVNLVGFYDDRSATRLEATDVPQIEVRGGLDALVEQARRREVDMVYIALPPRAEPRINALIRRLSDTTVSVYLAQRFVGRDLP